MKSILDKREVSRAQSGPRELKPPTSKEYAIQTLYHLKRVLQSLQCDQDEVRRELAEIAQYEHWRVLGYPSQEAMFDAELGELSALGKANAELAGIRPTARTGRPEKGTKLVPLTNGGTDRTIARLKRDRPELAKKVIAGELSAHAAAIEAGFRQRTIQVPLDPEKAAVILRRHFDGRQLASLKALL